MLIFFFFFLRERRILNFLFFFSSRRRHTRWPRDWSSDVCSSDLCQPSFQYSRGCDMRISMPLRTRNTMNSRFMWWLRRSHPENSSDCDATIACAAPIGVSCRHGVSPAHCGYFEGDNKDTLVPYQRFLTPPRRGQRYQTGLVFPGARERRRRAAEPRPLSMSIAERPSISRHTAEDHVSTILSQA